MMRSSRDLLPVILVVFSLGITDFGSSVAETNTNTSGVGTPIDTIQKVIVSESPDYAWLKAQPSEEFVKAVIPLMERDTSRTSAVWSAWAMQLLAHHKAARFEKGRQLLLRALDDEESRINAFTALAVAPREHADPVARGLTHWVAGNVNQPDVDPSHINRAIGIIGTLGHRDPETTQLLRRLATDTTEEFQRRRRSFQALIRTNGLSYLDSLPVPDDTVGARAFLRAIYHHAVQIHFDFIDKGEWEALKTITLRLLDYPAESIQSMAVYTFGNMMVGVGRSSPDPAMVRSWWTETLQDVIEQTDSPELRKRAEQELGKLRETKLQK